PQVCHSGGNWPDTGSPSQDECYTMLRGYQAVGTPVAGVYYNAFKATLGSDTPFPDPAYNNVTERLSTLLWFLRDSLPAQAWGDFIQTSNLFPAAILMNWSKVVLVGHSNGTGVVSYLANSHKVDRLLMFNGPVDFLGEDTNAGGVIHAPSYLRL